MIFHRAEAATVVAAFLMTHMVTMSISRPEYIGFDNGLIKIVVDVMCINFGLKKKLSTVYSLQQI